MAFCLKRIMHALPAARRVALRGLPVIDRGRGGLLVERVGWVRASLGPAARRDSQRLTLRAHQSHSGHTPTDGL
jgi:hypothetical protein